MAELFANNFASTLTIGCAPADQTIHVADIAPTALQGGQFRVLIDQEYMLVTAGQSTTTWTVTRGIEGTSAGTHFQGVWVTHLWTAGAIGAVGTVGGAVTTQGATGVNLDAAQTIDFSSIAQEIWLVGLLSADLAVSLKNIVAGCRAMLLLTQNGTGNWDVTVDGAGVTVSPVPGQLSVVEIKCPDYATEDMAVTSIPAGGLSDLGNVTTGAVLNVAAAAFRTFTFVLTAASCQISVINALPGSELVVVPFQDSSPPRLITHPAVVAWTSTGPPTLSSNANAPDRFQYTVLAVDGLGNPTKIVGSLGFTSGAPPQPINPPVIT